MADRAARSRGSAIACRAVIFDLDNCLCAASEVGEALFQPAFDAIRAANAGTLPEAMLSEALAACWHTAFDEVARRHGFSPAMTEAGNAAFGQLEVAGTLRGYPDLALVRDLPMPRFLVTTGYSRLQASKIRALGIAAWFDRVIVDAIDHADHPGKRRIFADLLRAGRWRPSELLVVGDNPLSELAAGRELGMTTVQLLRPGVALAADVDHRLRDLHELLALIHR